MLILLLILALAGCSGGQAQTALSVESTTLQTVSLQDTPVPATTAEGALTTAELEAAGAGAASAADALAENNKTHEQAGDTYWDESDMIPVQLNGTSISTGGAGVAVEGSVATIRAAGTYRLSGSLTDGQIIVETEDEDVVRLILDGVNLNCSSSAPVFIRRAEKVAVILADGSSNSVSDGSNYVYAEAGEDEPNAARGIKGRINVNIDGGTIRIDAADDAIHSNGSLMINAGSLTMASGDDGMHTDSTGDGIDANGSIEMTGGPVVVNGPVERMNGALDFVSFTITGGFIVAAGSSGMAQAPGSSSS